jgi:hypothetical protein
MTLEDLLRKYTDEVVYAFNIGSGYYDIIVADSIKREVYVVYTLTNDELWVENDEFGAIGHTVSWCIKHLCYAFPMWKALHDPKRHRKVEAHT